MLAFAAGVCLEVTVKIIQKGASHEGENDKLGFSSFLLTVFSKG